MKALVVDEDAEDRLLLNEHLRRPDHEVIDTNEGEEGLQKAAFGGSMVILSEALFQERLSPGNVSTKRASARKSTVRRSLCSGMNYYER